MTQTEAKMRILAEWRTWIGHRQAADFERSEEVRAFVTGLEQNQPDSLSFETDQSKLEVVTNWLDGAGLIR